MRRLRAQDVFLHFVKGDTAMNRSHRIVSTSFLSLFLAFFLAAYQQSGLTGETSREAGQTVEKAGKEMEQATDKLGEKAKEAGTYIDDAAITTAVKAEFLKDPLLKEAKISVTTTKGVVKLSGSVDSKAAKEKSAEIARGVKGVKSVKSKLVVKDPQ